MIKTLMISALALQAFSSVIKPNQCGSGSYFDFQNQVCATCSTLANTADSSAVSGHCVCATDYYWDHGACVACPTTGCPTEPVKPVQCDAGNYFDFTTQVCTSCTTVTNSVDSTAVTGHCVCATNYYWDHGACVACPTTGCPTAPSHGDEGQNGDKKPPQGQQPPAQGGNLRGPGGRK